MCRYLRYAALRGNYDALAVLPCSPECRIADSLRAPAPAQGQLSQSCVGFGNPPTRRFQAHCVFIAHLMALVIRRFSVAYCMHFALLRLEVETTQPPVVSGRGYAKTSSGRWGVHVT